MKPPRGLTGTPSEYPPARAKKRSPGCRFCGDPVGDPPEGNYILSTDMWFLGWCEACVREFRHDSGLRAREARRHLNPRKL